MCAACGSSKNESTETRTTDLIIDKRSDVPIADVLTLSRIVRLESRDETVIGSIGAVKVSDRSGDLLIGDYRSARKVFRFASDGVFLRTHGREGEGPGEYQGIRDFVILPDDSLMVLGSYEIIHYAADGAFVNEATLNVLPHAFVEESGAIFVRMARPPGSGGDPAFAVFDHTLALREYLGRFDQKIAKFPYWSRISLASKDNEIAFFDNFSLTLNRYLIREQTWVRHEFPDSTIDLEDYFQKERLTARDEQEIMNNLHQTLFILTLDQGYFFSEFQSSTERNHYSLFSPTLNTLYQFENDWRNGRRPGPWNYLVGATGTHLIGVLDDGELLEVLAQSYPELGEETLTPQDNPLLLFFELGPLDKP